MIPRYEKKEISDIWNDTGKFSRYLKVELAILSAFEKNGIVPKGLAETIEKSAVINPSRILEIEEVTKHDIISFCTSITEKFDQNVGKYFHFGVTSSDIIDTATTLQIRDSLAVILPKYKNLLKTLNKRSHEWKNLICIGRSHGMYAEPMSFGQKWLGHYCEFARRFNELQDFFDNDLTAQFSGAVGNYTIVTPKIESDAANLLGLKVESVSTQVIPRDRIAKLVSIIGLIGCAIERISIEIRHLHRSDVDELHEGFSKGQKGSSTMPHKKNPISGENLTGMSRILRSHVSLAMDNCLLWHERDISHSSAERMYLPDSFGLLCYSMDRLQKTIENLEIHTEKVEEKVKNSFTYLSSYYLHELIKASDCTREELYELVQKAAFQGHEQNSKKAFFDTLMKLVNEKNIKVTFKDPDFEEIKRIYLKNSDEVFNRVDKDYPIPQ